MIPALALIVAVYATARLMVLPAQVHGERAQQYAITVAVLAIGAIGYLVLELLTAQGTAPLSFLE